MSEFSTSIQQLRIRTLNQAPLNPAGQYVLYWMIAARRTGWNFALQHAVEMAQQLNSGLVVFEPLRCDYPYASERLHRFMLQGMADNQKETGGRALTYFPWVESSQAQGKGLLEALAKDACLVITDEYPAFFLPQMAQAAAKKLNVCLQTVDGNGLLPLQLVEREYPTAYAFRRFLHKALPAFIDDRPKESPLAGVVLPTVHLADDIKQSWPAADLPTLLKPRGLRHLPIDHLVDPVTQVGGSCAAASRLENFIARDLDHYADRRNVPDLDSTSRLSPYLHFGHISTHHIFSQLAEKEGWNSQQLSWKPTGQRSGWWGMSTSTEAFLDELVTWRELGYGFCRQRPDYAEYSALPKWARATLEQHRGDHRPYLYSYQQLCSAQTHDPLWNAAQRQLLTEGRIHGYLRMLWGKKILEWSESPQVALTTMLDLNDRYALDGRDPNAYSGISWCLGRFDRAWGPERPIFGKIRYMTSQNTARKVAVKKYLQRYGDQQEKQDQAELF